jgi:transcriptional regulator with XRE-family HTH domain
MYEIFEKLCKERGVTAYKVCKATGITTATISNWKVGRYAPKQEKLKKIADYFGVSVEYLMTGVEKTQKDSKSGMDKNLQKIIDCYANMNKEGKRLLVNQSVFFLEQYPKNTRSKLAT